MSAFNNITAAIQENDLRPQQTPTNAVVATEWQKQTAPLVSIIIPCRNERMHIANCLNDVLKQVEPVGGFEVLVVEGGSTDGTRAIIQSFVKQHDNLWMIENPEGTVPHAMNRGILSARGEYIARMDVHCRYASDYLVQALQIIRQTRAEAVGGPWRIIANTPFERAVAAAFASPFSAGGALTHFADYEGIVDTVCLGFFHKKKLIEVGLFDEELVRNQDDELNFRLVKSGGKLWQSPKIRLYYMARADLFGLFRQYLQYGFWKVRVMQKHGQPAALRHLIPGFFVAFLLLSILAFHWHPILQWGSMLLWVSYAVFLILGATIISKKAGWHLWPFLLPVLVAFHLGYGIGWLAGVYHFFIRRLPGSKASGFWQGLTR